MAASALAMRIAQWIAGGRQGPPPSGATAQDIAAAGLPPATSDVPIGPPGPPDAAAAEAKPERALPYPEPKDEYERARNQEQRLMWQLEDIDAAISAARANPTSPDYYNIPQLETSRSRISSDITSQQAVVRQALTAREAAEKKQPHTITRQERGPDGETYIVTYDVDAAGNEKWNGQKPVKLDLGTSPTAGLDLQTAQLNLDRARQQLADERDPLKRAQLQTQVEQAQLALQQARARGPLDLQTAQLNYDTALLAYQQATDETAREQRRLTLEQARVALDAAKQGLARGNAPQVIPADPSSPVIVTRDPTTGAITTQPNPAYQGRILEDPYAEYQRQVGLAQQRATQQRDALNDKVLRGELSTEDAQRQFDQWWGANVAQPLAPYQTMAETAYRKEQTEYDVRQAAERARVEAINRARQELAYGAGETARTQLNALAPSARSPEFLAQLAQNVSSIGKPLPGGVTQHSGGMQFSPESLSLANVRRAMPNLTEVGQNAAARALAAISPAAAQAIGAPPPRPPGLPEFADYMRTAPFTIPNPALPVPGEAALDLGNPANAARLGLPVQPGYAGTRYQGGRVEGPWQIPQV